MRISETSSNKPAILLRPIQSKENQALPTNDEKASMTSQAASHYPSPYATDHSFAGIKSISKYEVPFNTLLQVVHRKITMPAASRFIDFQLVQYLEFEKIDGGTVRKICFDTDRTPRNEEMAAMKEQAQMKLVFFLFAAVFDDKSPMMEKGIVIARTRESLNNFNVDYFIGSAAKNYTTHYHCFGLKE